MPNNTRLTYNDLLDRLADLNALSLKPQPGERGGCVSSFDRRSRYIPEEDRYADWDANDDGTGFVRKLDDGSVVALELEGPGALVRSWSAMPSDGHIRIFIDGELAVDTPFIRYFTGFGQDFAPGNTPDVCPRISRGYNSFIPVPFQKGIRVEFAPGWGMYYHFTYALFPDGTLMPPYSDLFTRAGRIALAKLDRRLHARGMSAFTPSIRATVQAGGSVSLYEADGSGALTSFQLKPREAGSANDLLVLMYWDGEAEPSVRAPLPELFGTVAGDHPFASYPCGYVGGTYYTRWHMPYADGARVELVNLGDKPTDIEADILVEACPGASDRLRFHASWTRGGFDGLDRPRFEPGGDRWPDWPMLRVSGGAGRFCGVHLRVLDRFAYPGGMKPGEWWFGYDGCERLDWWWGEGDEKFFVDGEKFPSTFGTGSEDYFGYAWAAEPPFALFDSPFAAMSAMPLDGNGITSACRFHVADNVPFQRSFEAFIEKYKGERWGESNRCSYAATAYWYQAAGAENAVRLPTREEIMDIE
ncbi:MAG: DUF2961 domain-containing protein [Oscillospiraceae bacterium]|jgi:hypothetical protein|nr:DUF2961 domain-containing protein [Oscillospiraceae bacterium]